MADKIDYSILKFQKVKARSPEPGARSPKPAAPRKPAAPKARARVKTTKHRGKRNRVAMKAAADDRALVFARQGQVCYGHGVSPVCTGQVKDPHELIPVSRGGERRSYNRVGLCRPCHDSTDATLGGRRLQFDWPGKAERQPPNADLAGNVTVAWRDRSTRQPAAAGGKV